MAGKYDEDMYENPYFLKIMSDHLEFLEKVVTSKGSLCVPKYSIASSWSPTLEDVEDHILFPTADIDDNSAFITASKKTVHISDGKLVTKDGFPVSRQVPILFAETFHTDNGGSYQVFCIGGLLNKAVDKSDAGSPVKAISPTSYRQCLELLWSHSGGHKMRDSLDKILNTYAATYDRLEGETLRSIVDVANTHFTKAMQLLLKDSVVRRSVQRNPYYMDNLKVAVETYVMNSVHKRLFRVITATMSGQDAEINKINRNLIHLQLSDLGIRKIFSQNIIPAKKELNLLNRYSTPMGRLFCLKRVVATLTKPMKHSGKESSKETVAMMTTDDLLPILIFLIIKSEIPNWMANLVYMRHFHFAKSSDDDEFGFYLASVEAALEHIKSGNIKDEIRPMKLFYIDPPENCMMSFCLFLFLDKCNVQDPRERWNTLLVPDPAENASPPTSTSPSRQLSHSSLDDFFRYVQEGNEERVQKMLERPYKTSEEVHLKLCHPLCSCDKCDKLLSDFRSNSDLVTAYTRDSRGYTALHIAAYYGQGLLIDLLIQNNAVVDATDYLGLTPLHLACQRGYQNVMLLLLHFGADVMATDNEGNTPLHLCCANGHDDCVKALVFYEASMKRLRINVANEFGDTPLHLAAKWGYETIVKTLLENGADAALCNRKKQTPVSLAQNVIVQRWLQLAAEDPDFQPIKPQQFVSPTAKSRSRASSDSSVSTQNSTYSGLRSGKVDLFEPESSSARVETASLEVVSENEMMRKKEKLFKAVVEGDIQLVKFYLGIMNEDDDGDSDDVQTPPTVSAVGDMCHPLCQCNKCQGLHKVTQKSENAVNINSRTTTGYCPIHMAVLHNHSDIVALLIAQNADVSVQNHKSLTPLHLSCCTRNSLITDMLVKAGASLNVHDINGDTPVLIAASSGFINGVEILTKAGANVNATNHKGSTALHEALKRESSDIVDILLKAGADPRIRNKQGKLPQDECEDPAMRSLLLVTSLRLQDADAKARNVPQNLDLKGNNGQVSIKELFAAFEEKDLQKLQKLALGIRSFDRKASLRRTKTHDMSSPSLEALTHKHLIQSFDKNTLRRTTSLHGNDPLHLHGLSKTASSDVLSSRHSSNFDEQLTPMGDNSHRMFVNFDDSPLTPFPDSDLADTVVINSTISSSFDENSIMNPVLEDVDMSPSPREISQCSSETRNVLQSSFQQSELSTMNDDSQSSMAQVTGIISNLPLEYTQSGTEVLHCSNPVNSEVKNIVAPENEHSDTDSVFCDGHSTRAEKCECEHFVNSGNSLLDKDLNIKMSQDDDLCIVKPSGVSLEIEKLSVISLTTEKSPDESLTTGNPSDESLMTEKPSDESLATGKPSDESLTIEKPSDESLTVEKLSDESLTTGEPSVESLTIEKSSDEILTTEKPSDESLTIEKPSDESLTIEKPSDESLTIEKPSDESLTVEKPSGDILKIEKPSDESLKIEKSSDESLKIEKPSDESLKIEKPSDESLKIEKPSDESLKIEKPSDESLKIEKSSDESLKIEKPSDESLKIEKSSDESLKIEKPSDESLKIEKPSDESLKIEKPSDESLKIEKSSDESLKIEKPSDDSLKIEKPSDESLKIEESSDESLKIGKSSDKSLIIRKPCVMESHMIESFAVEKALDESLTIEKALDESLTIEKALDESLTIEKALDESLTIEKALDESLTIEKALDESLTIEKALDESLTIEKALDESLTIEKALDESFNTQNPQTDIEAGADSYFTAHS